MSEPGNDEEQTGDGRGDLDDDEVGSGEGTGDPGIDSPTPRDPESPNLQHP